MLESILPTFSLWNFQNKRELQYIALNHSSNIDLKDLIDIYKKCIAELYSFLVNEATLPSDNPLGFRKNVLKINT